jgi:hypothetical protein
MYAHWVEHRSLQHGESLSWDIARHFFARHDRPAIVITDAPAALMAAVSKQWQKVIRQVQRERSSSLDSSKIYELSLLTTRMQDVHMSAGTHNGVGLRFMRPEDVLREAPECATMYVTIFIQDAMLEKLARNMDEGGLIVLY